MSDPSVGFITDTARPKSAAEGPACRPLNIGAPAFNNSCGVGRRPSVSPALMDGLRL